ncbi:MAG: hypothetical protein AUF76_16390 [Acidobacteria bacterium 13_1_20CM_2_65_9]|nr:MAG: hypothetical protein AUF76_16390 [Acidobacteria bacterium 13_1_20CM_2_65_9]
MAFEIRDLLLGVGDLLGLLLDLFAEPFILSCRSRSSSRASRFSLDRARCRLDRRPVIQQTVRRSPPVVQPSELLRQPTLHQSWL